MLAIDMVYTIQYIRSNTIVSSWSLNAKWCQRVVFHNNLQNWNNFGDWIESLSETAVSYLAKNICDLFGLKWKWILSIVIIQAQEKSFPSMIILIMTVDYFNEYCVNIVTHFFDKNAQYRKKIVAKSGIQHKARLIHMGNYNQLSTLGLQSIIMRPTCYHVMYFCFLFYSPHPRI